MGRIVYAVEINVISWRILPESRAPRLAMHSAILATQSPIWYHRGGSQNGSNGFADPARSRLSNIPRVG